MIERVQYRHEPITVTEKDISSAGDKSSARGDDENGKDPQDIREELVH